MVSLRQVKRKAEVVASSCLSFAEELIKRTKCEWIHLKSSDIGDLEEF